MGVPRPWARQPPPGGMRPTFLTSRWIIWPGKRARIGLLTRLVCPVGPGVAPSVQAGSVQPSGHGTRRHHCPAHSQLVADAEGGPLVGTAPVLDEVHRLGAGAGGAVKRGAGTVLKLRDSSLAVTSRPTSTAWHGQCRLRRLRGRWGDRPGHASRAGSGPEVSKRCQRSVTVGYGSGAFSCRKDDSAPPILTAQAPLPPTPHDYNLMTHNT